MEEKVTVNGLAEGLVILIEEIREQNQGQRRRLLIMDSQLRVLNEFAQRLENLEAQFEGILRDYKAHCRICARLNILCSNIDTKEQGPHDSEEKDLEEKLTHWN